MYELQGGGQVAIGVGVFEGEEGRMGWKVRNLSEINIGAVTGA